MIKLITPPGMLLTVAILAIYAAYAWAIGTIERSVPLLLGAGISAIACVGVALLQRWSRFLVYLLALGFIAKLVESIYWGVRSGYFDMQFDSRHDIVMSLLPSAAMAMLSMTSCWLVYRHFAKQDMQG